MTEKLNIVELIEELEKISKWETQIKMEYPDFTKDIAFWRLRLKMSKRELREDFLSQKPDTPVETFEEYENYIPWILELLEAPVKQIDLLRAERERCWAMIDKAYEKLHEPKVGTGQRKLEYQITQHLVREELKKKPIPTMNEAIHNVAEKLGKTYEAVKSSLYYKPKSDERGSKKSINTTLKPK